MNWSKINLILYIFLATAGLGCEVATTERTLIGGGNPGNQTTNSENVEGGTGSEGGNSDQNKDSSKSPGNTVEDEFHSDPETVILENVVTPEFISQTIMSPTINSQQNFRIEMQKFFINPSGFSITLTCVNLQKNCGSINWSKIGLKTNVKANSVLADLASAELLKEPMTVIPIENRIISADFDNETQSTTVTIEATLDLSSKASPAKHGVLIAAVFGDDYSVAFAFAFDFNQATVKPTSGKGKLVAGKMRIQSTTPVLKLAATGFLNADDSSGTLLLYNEGLANGPLLSTPLGTTSGFSEFLGYQINPGAGQALFYLYPFSLGGVSPGPNNFSLFAERGSEISFITQTIEVRDFPIQNFLSHDYSSFGWITPFSATDPNSHSISGFEPTLFH